jgi:Secretion system C-terminal sorting domain
MRTLILFRIKKAACLLSAVIGSCCFFPVFSQQYVIAEKDNTHPEITEQSSSAAFITSFTAERENGYNEIAWTARNEQDVRKYIIEYSTDGINYQTAGETVTADAPYTLKHASFEDQPLIYRIKMEQFNGKLSYSAGIVLDGMAIAPVKIYPNIIQGNVVNITAAWPVEKINIVSSNGTLVFAQAVNGRKDYMSVTLPSLAKGMYWMNFYGNGWKTTSKFFIP